ncbi:hypothetical protein [Chryseobacterium sp. JK1]|uniref:hypothetical protein n=1 Tax=Chryseobacterium sp. JK1 TaxID=874294 RepID=UPI003D68933F
MKKVFLIKKITKYMNKYIEDSKIFLNYVSDKITEELSDNDVIQIAINLSLGMERLLKGILFEVNPLYILIEPNFNHSIQHIYSEKIIIQNKKTKELPDKFNEDVITFKTSLLRAQIVSNTVYNHKNILFAISNIRDILAHCDLQLLNKVETKQIISRDFYPMIKSFAKELKINENAFFNSNQIKLSSISSALQTDLNMKFSIMKDEFKGKWKLLKKIAGYTESKILKTEEIYDIGNKFKYKCPACRNTALMYFKPVREEYISSGKVQEVITGFLIQNLKCEFCGFETDEAVILDLVMSNKRNDVDQGINIYDERV